MTSFVLLSVIVTLTGGVAQAAPGGIPGAPTWSHKGGQPGCGAATTLVPTESAAYYAEHPDEFVTDPDMPYGMKAQLEEIALNRPTVVTSISCSPGQAKAPSHQGAGSNYTLPWSGYWTGNTSSVATFATLTWTVPTLSGTSAKSSVVVWPGLGSGNAANDTLVQAGTVQASSTTYFWWEMWPYYKTTQNISSNTISVSPGDNVSVMVYFDTGTKTATFDFYNITKNKLVAVSVPLPPGQAFMGKQAEWVVERTVFSDGTYSILPNFGTISLSRAGYEVSGSSSTTVTNSSYSTLTMTTTGTSSGNILASPGPASSTGNFLVTWHRAQ